MKIPALRLTRCMSAAVEAGALLCVPAVLAACVLTGFNHTALLSFGVVLAALAVFFARYEASAPRLRDVMPVAVLAALAAAGRILFAALPSFKPVTAIAVIAGVAFGRRSGFMVGALAALASNFFFGQGTWTPWQMYAWGLAGYGAGLLAQAGLDRRLAFVCAYGFCASLAFGFIMNCWSVLGFLRASMAVQLAAVCLSSLPFDLVHGASTVAFLAVLYAPWRRKLERVRRVYQDSEHILPDSRTTGRGRGDPV